MPPFPLIDFGWGSRPLAMQLRGFRVDAARLRDCQALVDAVARLYLWGIISVADSARMNERITEQIRDAIRETGRSSTAVHLD